jgi:RNA polymerase sigma factor (sigma-70 family)
LHARTNQPRAATGAEGYPVAPLYSLIRYNRAMPPAERGPATATRASIFIRLKDTDAQPRELAWKQFYERYAPVISSYAYRNGASRQQAEELVQDIISGFFEASPRFVYDPARGRFRAYLKSCVVRALARRKLTRERARAVPIELGDDVPDARDDGLWEKLWQQQIICRAMEIVREHYSSKGKLLTFHAFELNVVKNISAAETAKSLGMNIGSVHTAKSRVTDKLRDVRAMLEDEEG